MKKTTLFIFTLLFAISLTQAQDGQRLPDIKGDKTPTVLEDPSVTKEFQATITPEDLAAHLYLFASDYFEGRETTAKGQKLAARYLASQYQRLGFTPKGTLSDDPRNPESYLQSFPLKQEKLKEMNMKATRNGNIIAETNYGGMNSGSDAYVQMAQPLHETGKIVFAGYGISDEKLGYDDYKALADAGIDVSGKWILVLADEPLKDAETSLLPTEDGKPSNWTTRWFTKLQPAYASANPPLGILVVSDLTPRSPGDFGETVQSRAEALSRSVGSLSLPTEEEGGRRRRNRGALLNISADFANKLLASSGKTVQSLQASIDGSLKPMVLEVSDVDLSINIENSENVVTSENVVAYLEGTDLKDEYVVVTSHYDHVGMAATPNADGDYIYNGADDDGSGTVTVLEIAEAFAKAAQAGYRPRRTVVFMNVSGEEKGLLGSAYYADKEPMFPLDKTVTNLNIDMVGRHDPTHPDPEEQDYVYIIGSKLISQELHDLNSAVNDITGTNLVLHERFNSKDDPNQFYRRSDHWNFGKHNIPFIFFFTGTHEDYHGLDDEPEKIDYTRMARIGQMIFATAWQVANQDVGPAVSGKGFND